MSAILSSDDLNDFISPGVACIKPLEALPEKEQENSSNSYEVTTEDKVAASNPAPPAQISLTDCLACSGCVTSAEAVLVSLQSQTEVLNTLDAHPSLSLPQASNGQETEGSESFSNGQGTQEDGRLFVASISPQVRASLAAVFDVSEKEAGHMIAQLLSGQDGMKSGGKHGSSFTWVVDTNTVREAALVLSADEVASGLSETPDELFQSPAVTGSTDKSTPKKPILASACPGWICYAEKTHPHVLPHLSRLKSPQALAGTLLKSVLSRAYGIPPSRIWHLAVMPCFDKKLEASRGELTDAAWTPTATGTAESVRDVDCVITARELLHLADARGIQFASLPRSPVSGLPRFPDPTLDNFLFPLSEDTPNRSSNTQPPVPPRAGGSSGGFLAHILTSMAASYPPGSTDIRIQRGRNSDVVEYSLVQTSDNTILARAARFYGFRNIQNLVRRLKPKKVSRLPGAAARRNGPASANNQPDYAYVEVMACPGGCTNGGGQVRAQEVAEVRAAAGDPAAAAEMETETKAGPEEQRQWLAKVDEAYFSGSDAGDSSGGETPDAQAMDVDSGPKTNGRTVDVEMDVDDDSDVVNGISRRRIWSVLRHWETLTGSRLQDLVLTSFREVESDVGRGSDMDRVAGFAGAAGGGW